jgi:16S rRNA (cytidine1402-2'-O)-methyltransferase
MDEETKAAASLMDRVKAEIARVAARSLEPGLHIVATPIGNLGDVTLRALCVLAAADAVYCEDTRHSGSLMTHFGLHAKLAAYHEHNAERERPRIVERLNAGQKIALISDAGTPLISDPGYKLVRDVVAAGHAVYALPGPCAAIAALTVAGLPTDSFMFAGFLPAKSGQRISRLKELAAVPATLVFYEAPTRAADALADMAAVLGDRQCALTRELTKLHEDVQRGSLVDLANRLAGTTLRGEIAIVVAPPSEAEVTDDVIVAALALALETASTRDAVRLVAERLGAAKTRVYDLAMSLKRGSAT